MSHSQFGELTLTQENFVFNFVKKDEGMSKIMQLGYDVSYIIQILDKTKNNLKLLSRKRKQISLPIF